jgi:hypothetical protein
MIEQVFSANFSDELKKLPPALSPSFVARGEIYADEIVARVSLVLKNHLAGATVLASTDFDPQASAPKAEELLSHCVDAIGQIFQGLFELPSSIQTFIEGELSEAKQEGLPLQWTELEVEKRKIFVKLDKSNPVLEEAADAWLSKHDPEHAVQLKQDEQEAEKLFVLPPKPSKKNVH